MNWYLFGAMVTIAILGLIIGTSIGRDRGYEDAIEDYRQQMANIAWSQYYNQLQGGDNDEKYDQQVNE